MYMKRIKYFKFKFRDISKEIYLRKSYFRLLKTKHILRFFIGGLKQRQLARIYKIIYSKRLFLTFLTKLEYRIEFILIKAGFVLTGKQARQLISHKHIIVNGQRTQFCNLHIKMFDIISLESVVFSKYKRKLVSSFFKTPGFFGYLRRRGIKKKLTVQRMFIYAKFQFFCEANYKIFTLIFVRKLNLHKISSSQVLLMYG